VRRVRLAYIATFWFRHTLGLRCGRLSGRRKALGRFTLREAGLTIAAGTVLS
jgi:hypothetical protein